MYSKLLTFGVVFTLLVAQIIAEPSSFLAILYGKVVDWLHTHSFIIIYLTIFGTASPDATGSIYYHIKSLFRKLFIIISIIHNHLLTMTSDCLYLETYSLNIHQYWYNIHYISWMYSFNHIILGYLLMNFISL